MKSSAIVLIDLAERRNGRVELIKTLITTVLPSTGVSDKFN